MLAKNHFTNKKLLQALIFTAYITVIAIIYISFVLTANRNAALTIENDMKFKFGEITTAMDADFDKKLVDISYLVQNNAFSAALKLGLKSQLTDFTVQEQKNHSSLSRLLVADDKNNILYNSSEFLSDVKDINRTVYEYSGYIYKERILRIHYIPVYNSANENKGMVIAAYDFSDFYETIAARLFDTGYKLYGFVDRNAVFIVDETGTAHVNIPLNTAADKLAEGYSSLIIDGQKNYILNKKLYLDNSKKIFTLSLAIPDQRYNELRSEYVGAAIKNASLTAVLITLVLGALYFLIRHYTEKDFLRRIEIRTLHVQKHDFSKHLNIIMGMCLTGENDELKQYVSCLSDKIIFEGKLSQIGNAALGVLLEDKKYEAEEFNIPFELEIDTTIANLDIDPTDLCTAIANIIDNGIEATKDIETDAGGISICIDSKDGFYSFNISNRGRPILEKDISKIFEPGYSTKDVNYGHGMGLYIVKRIIKKYNGRVEVKCSGGITSFILYFPVEKRKGRVYNPA